MASQEFYQTFRDKLMPILVKLFQNIAGEGPLPNSFYKANITLTPTRERQQKRSKLQAKSLMKIAATILKKILANRNDTSNDTSMTHQKAHTPWPSWVYRRNARILHYKEINQCDTFH